MASGGEGADMKRVPVEGPNKIDRPITRIDSMDDYRPPTPVHGAHAHVFFDGFCIMCGQSWREAMGPCLCAMGRSRIRNLEEDPAVTLYLRHKETRASRETLAATARMCYQWIKNGTTREPFDIAVNALKECKYD